MRVSQLYKHLAVELLDTKNGVSVTVHDTFLGDGVVSLRMLGGASSHQGFHLAELLQFRLKLRLVVLQLLEINLFREALLSHVSNSHLNFTSFNEGVAAVKLSVTLLEDARPELKTVFATFTEDGETISSDRQDVVHDDELLLTLLVEAQDEAASLLVVVLVLLLVENNILNTIMTKNGDGRQEVAVTEVALDHVSVGSSIAVQSCTCDLTGTFVALDEPLSGLLLDPFSKHLLFSELGVGILPASLLCCLLHDLVVLDL